MKRLIIIGTLLSATLLAGCGTNSAQPKIQASGKAPQAVACTMDAKQCPDGSYVGRIGPNCEFATCPSEGGEIACTEEARLCPDGTSVARVAPSCEFAPCPTTNTGERVICRDSLDASCGTGK